VCARVGGWDRLPAECVGEGEIGAGAGRRRTPLHLGRRRPVAIAENRRAYVAVLQAADHAISGRSWCSRGADRERTAKVCQTSFGSGDGSGIGGKSSSIGRKVSRTSRSGGDVLCSMTLQSPLVARQQVASRRSYSNAFSKALFRSRQSGITEVMRACQSLP